MKMLALTAALSFCAIMSPAPALANTTVAIYGGGSSASVSLPDTMAAALVASGRAVVEDPADNAKLTAIIATFSSANISFLTCVARNSCGTGPVAVGTLDFSDPTQSAFIL